MPDVLAFRQDLGFACGARPREPLQGLGDARVVASDLDVTGRAARSARRRPTATGRRASATRSRTATVPGPAESSGHRARRRRPAGLRPVVGDVPWCRRRAAAQPSAAGRVRLEEHGGHDLARPAVDGHGEVGRLQIRAPAGRVLSRTDVSIVSRSTVLRNVGRAGLRSRLREARSIAAQPDTARPSNNRQR